MYSAIEEPLIILADTWWPRILVSVYASRSLPGLFPLVPVIIILIDIFKLIFNAS